MDQQTKAELNDMNEIGVCEEDVIKYLVNDCNPRNAYHGMRHYFKIASRHFGDDDGDVFEDIQASHDKKTGKSDKQSRRRNYYTLRMIELSYKDIPQIRPKLAQYIRQHSRDQIASMWSFCQWMLCGMPAHLQYGHDFYKSEEDYDEDDWAQSAVKAQFVKAKWEFVSEVITAFWTEAEKGQMMEHEKKTLDAFASGHPDYFDREWSPNA